MTPVFKSNSSHKYDTIDYYQIDPSFGTTEDLRELVQEANKMCIRDRLIILSLLCYTFIHSMSLRFVIVFWRLNYTKTIGSVSYTHLDVYKRQVLTSFIVNVNR